MYAAFVARVGESLGVIG
jgi:secreted trypsin-like serine protease